MSDEASQPQAAPAAEATPVAPRKPLPTWARYVIAAAVLLALFWVQSFSATLRANSIWRETTVKGVEVAAALFSETRQEGSAEVDMKRAARMVQAAQAAGGFDVVTLVDRGGQVIASTDRNLERAQVAELKTPPARTQTQPRGVSLTVDVPVTFGGPPVGTLRVEASRE